MTRLVVRPVQSLIFLLAVLAVSLSAPPAARAAAPQDTVDLAKIVIEDFRGDPNFARAMDLLENARAVIIVPRLLKAGFIIGGSGGTGVLLARDGAGNWSSPAFVTLGAGSIGLQAGVQDSRVMLVIMNDRALNALLAHDFKLGADVSVTVGPTGAGVEAATTSNLQMDIFSFAKTRGLFGGASVEGAVIVKRDDLNSAYYGTAVTVAEIVIGQKVANSGATALRALLAKH